MPISKSYENYHKLNDNQKWLYRNLCSYIMANGSLQPYEITKMAEFKSISWNENKEVEQSMLKDGVLFETKNSYLPTNKCMIIALISYGEYIARN